MVAQQHLQEAEEEEEEEVVVEGLLHLRQQLASGLQLVMGFCSSFALGHVSWPHLVLPALQLLSSLVLPAFVALDAISLLFWFLF